MSKLINILFRKEGIIILNHEELKKIAGKYFSEASNEQIENIVDELSREIEIMAHAKIRELVNVERNKKNIRSISH